MGTKWNDAERITDAFSGRLTRKKPSWLDLMESKWAMKIPLSHLVPVGGEVSLLNRGIVIPNKRGSKIKLSIISNQQKSVYWLKWVITEITFGCTKG